MMQARPFPPHESALTDRPLRRVMAMRRIRRRRYGRLLYTRAGVLDMTRHRTTPRPEPERIVLWQT